MAKSKIGVFTESTARTIFQNAGGSQTVEVNQDNLQPKRFGGIWCITTDTIAKRTAGAIIGSTVDDAVDCDVVDLVNNVVTATGRKLKVRNASAAADIPSGVLICPFPTNWGWAAIYEDCDA